jgi:hypothetical protein
MGIDHWKMIAATSGLLAALGGVEWFVTYCVFSDYCPLVVAIADGIAG